MKKLFPLRVVYALLLLVFSSLSTALYAQPANDACANATVLSSGTTCTTTSGTLRDATAVAGVTACGITNPVDVWYRFVAGSTNPIISLSSMGNSMEDNPRIQLFSGTCGSLTSLACVTGTNTTSLSMNTSTAGGPLTVGTTYYIRIHSNSTSTGGGASSWNFNICVQDPPSNDLCANATTLTSSTTCSNTAGTLSYSTSSSPTVASTCTGTPGGDVWYSFVANSVYPQIALSSIGSSFSSAGVRIQLLSGSCAGFTSLACLTGTSSSLTMNTAVAPGGAGLTVGSTYFVRVYSPTASPTGNNWGFNICVTDPTDPTNIEYSRSYINVTKGSTGGTVHPGDTLEMRATFVVRSGSSIDSLGFYDTLFNTRGIRLVPGSIALRTNEGKIYQSFTDTYDADAGWYQTNGADTVIRINFGTGATNVARGSLSNTSLPSVFGSTCIVMATYRVVVYADYNTTINFKTGALTYRAATTGSMYKRTFATNNLIVYASPGLCPNAVSPSNALGGEFNGTFGEPSGATPHARNRGTSAYTTYTYHAFSTGNGPEDTEYGIANNTSATYSTTTTWPKPDGGGYRLFGQWDISGDHTNATDQNSGNLPCDINQPISPTNPCGYMLVVNASYKTDTAFTYTVSGLCPNTYYEIAAWFKNICYKCGCDVNGRGSGDAGYIPTAPGDSSGVRPNIAFDVNGIDYYTTGDILYYGTTPTGSDASNRWVKRGFTYLTGAAQTSFTLTIRNNAPGGGGNDWAMDDIAVATCSPDLSFTPSNNPPSCSGNNLEITGTVNSYFSNYVNYKWQRRADSSSSWYDVSTAAVGTPTFSSGQYTYAVDFNTGVLTTADSGVQFRLVTATTAGNLSTSNCSLDGAQGVSITVNNCSPVLGTNFISFIAKAENNQSILNWTTDKESESMEFIIEKSSDGLRFLEAGRVNSNKNYSNALNTYNWREEYSNGKVYYRIKMLLGNGGKKYSKTVIVDNTLTTIESLSVVNPFSTALSVNIHVAIATKATLQLIDNSGVVVRSQTSTLESGQNQVAIKDVKQLAPGFYTLKILANHTTITKKLLKQ